MPKGIKAEESEGTENLENKLEQAVATVTKPNLPEAPVVEVVGEEATRFTRVYPQIRVGVCEFHGTPYGRVDLNTMTGRCFHRCSDDPLCPHAKNGCESQYKTLTTTDENQNETVIGKEAYCRHEHNYAGLALRCSYCPANTDVRGVLKKRTLYVFENPDNPKKLIMVCSDYRCVDKHHKRFERRNV